MKAWSDAWRALRRLFWGVVAVLALVVVAEGARLALAAAAIHPALGWAVALALAGAVIHFLIAPATRLLRWRAALPRPAKEASLAEWRAYGRHLSRHHSLRGGEAAATARLLLADASDATGAREASLPLCQALDASGRAAVERAAVKAFALTAISQRAAWDALAVLAVQAGMISDIAGVYRERPTLTDLGGLGRRVVVASGIAGGLDALGDQAAQAILRSWTGVMKVATVSVAQGMLNAFITLRVGEIARQAAAGQPTNATAASWWALGRLSLLPVQGVAGAAWSAGVRGLQALREKVGAGEGGRAPARAPAAPMEA